MRLESLLTDSSILRELGSRLKRNRVDAALTQAQLAERAGIAKRTVERLEAGHSTESVALIRVLRALKMLENLEGMLPDAPQSPITLLKSRGRERTRVRVGRAEVAARKKPSWKWGD